MGGSVKCQRLDQNRVGINRPLVKVAVFARISQGAQIQMYRGNTIVRAISIAIRRRDSTDCDYNFASKTYQLYIVSHQSNSSFQSEATIKGGVKEADVEIQTGEPF